MLPTKLAFVDIETTGMRSSYDRIIEIGILRVENGVLVDTFHSLINPQSYIPQEITKLTGITSQTLEHAPTFRHIKNDIKSILNDCTFVAHNVRFDYGFLKNEFIRENITFQAKHFCTVRLSRMLFPQWQRHNLDALITNCNISCESRHRAFDDAKVLYHFYQYIQKNFTPDILENAILKTQKKPSLPINLPIEMLDSIPDNPGVYIFYGNATKDLKKPTIPLYVGKSINMKNRVLSHFSADLVSSTEMKIAQQITSIETVSTAGELGALILESQLIKKMLPLYNKKSRIKHELVALKKSETKNGYLTCTIESLASINPTQLDLFLGFYRSKKQAKAYLSAIAKDFTLCEKLLGLEKTNSACFAHRLNRCHGACIQKEKPELYNVRFQMAFSDTQILPWPFNSKIAIKESSLDGSQEYFIIDKWCFIGKVSVDEQGNQKDALVNEVTFDLDIYKIVKQYIKNPKNRNNITSNIHFELW